MTLSSDDVVALADVTGAGLALDVAEQLPASTPGPPWTVTVSGLTWMQRATRDARSAMTAPLTPRRGFAVTTCGFMRYLDSPVGSYSEVIAAPCLAEGGRRGYVHVPFIAVDSVPSVHGGRAHWALPKVLASFEWTDGRVRAAGDGWSLGARIRRRGPRIPVRGKAEIAQVDPHGRVGVATMSMRGWGRLVLIEAEVGAESPHAAWLTPGRHLGVEIGQATMTVGMPEWRS
jgi:acetoacetate decarboxylase